jgi:hypothetical protein
MSRAASAVLLIGALVACGDSEQGGTGANGGGASGPTGSGGAGGTGGAGGGGGTSPIAAEEAFRLLTGTFDSADQADMSPTYFAIQLTTCPVDAPELGERVLYIEQAVLETVTQPYRQRFYVVSPGADPTTQAVSAVYELQDPDAFIGACDGPKRTVTAAEAIARPGCDVLLTRASALSFAGGTSGKACESTLQGASYATSEVTLDEVALESWDRGYDDMDTQVWGATQGPYVFIRRTALPPP